MSLKNILLFLLLFLLPSQLAFHFWPASSFVAGVRVDYLAPTLFLTDILVIFYVLVSLPKTLAKLNKRYWLFLLFLFVFAGINIYGAQNQEAAFLKWLKLLEMIFLGTTLARSGAAEVLAVAKKALPLSLAFFSFLGICQFFGGRTIGGPFYFLGERTFSLQTPGIALYRIFGTLKLRPYSTFPHPNVYGSFLFLVGSFLWLSEKRKTLVYKSAVFIAFLGAFLSGSLGVYLAAFLALAAKSFKFFRKNLLTLGLIFSFLFLLFSFFSLGINLSQTLTMRLLLAKISGLLFLEKPLFGVGLNNFIVNLPRLAYLGKDLWRLQPVHNIFLLALSETGVLGLGFLVLFLRQVFSKSGHLFLLIAFMAITGLVDHYWLTIQQSQLLFTFIAGYIFSVHKKNAS